MVKIKTKIEVLYDSVVYAVGSVIDVDDSVAQRLINLEHAVKYDESAPAPTPVVEPEPTPEPTPEVVAQAVKGKKAKGE